MNENMTEIYEMKKSLEEFAERAETSADWPEMPQELWGKDDSYYIRLAMTLLDQGGIKKSDLREIWRRVNRYL